MSWEIELLAGHGPGPVRVGRWRGAGGGRGRAVLVPGRGDSLELRAGVAARLAADLGLDVIMPEHHGQGGSGHLGRHPDAVHIHDFGVHEGVVRAVVERERRRGPAAGPLYLLSHSMGGLVALHVLARAPAPFAAAVFVAPMWRFAGALPLPVVGALAGAMCALGRGAALAAGERPFELARCLDMRTGDPAQRARLRAFAAAHRALVRGGSTWRWVAAAARAMRAIDRLPLGQIAAPVVVVSPREDETVSRAAHARIASRLPRGRCLEVPGRHDALSEGPRTAAPLWGAIAALFGGPVGGAGAGSAA